MKKFLKISSTEDGLFLDDFILSFDSCRSKHLSFLSSAVNPFLDISARIFATEETLRIFQTFDRKPNALVCQYNRPFFFGKLRIELLPSGGVLGGASLHVETEGLSLLYAPLLRSKGFLSLRSMQLKSASVLILNALHPLNISSKVKRKNEIDKLFSRVESDIQSGSWPVIVCPQVGIAQELSYLFSERNIPLTVHRSIYKVHKVYEQFGSQVGSYTQFNPSREQKAVLLLPHSRFLRNLQVKGRRLKYLVQGDFVEFEEHSRDFDEKFYLNLHADMEEIKSIVIPEVRPKRLVLFGPYAKNYAEELKSQVPAISTVFQNNQPDLF